MIDINQAKKKAWDVRSLLVKSGFGISHSKSLDTVAVVHGFENWNHIVASVENFYCLKGRYTMNLFNAASIGRSTNDDVFDSFSARVFSKSFVDANPILHAILAEPLYSGSGPYGMIACEEKYIQLFDEAEWDDGLYAEQANVLKFLKVPFDFITLEEAGGSALSKDYYITLTQFTGDIPYRYDPIYLCNSNDLQNMSPPDTSLFQVAVAEVYGGSIFKGKRDLDDLSAGMIIEHSALKNIFFFVPADDDVLDIYACDGSPYYSAFHFSPDAFCEFGASMGAIDKGVIPIGSFAIDTELHILTNVLKKGLFGIRDSGINIFNQRKGRVNMFEYVNAKNFEVTPLFDAHYDVTLDGDSFLIVPEYAIHHPILANILTGGGCFSVSSDVIPGHLLIAGPEDGIRESEHYDNTHLALLHAGIQHYEVWAYPEDGVMNVGVSIYSELSDFLSDNKEVLVSDIEWGEEFQSQLKDKGLTGEEILLSHVKQQFGKQLPFMQKKNQKNVDPAVFWEDHQSLLEALFFIAPNMDGSTASNKAGSYMICDHHGHVLHSALRLSCPNHWSNKEKESLVAKSLGVDEKCVISMRLLPDTLKLKVAIKNMETGKYEYISFE